MNKEEKDLLLKDLCARLPYGVKIKVRGNNIRTVRMVDMVEEIVHFVELDSISPFGVHIECPTTFQQVVKPYLRPMSSMTKEEKEELKKLCGEDLSEFAGFIKNGHGLSHDGLYMFDKLRQLEFCLSHHLDFRGMIEKGLALEAPEDMYNLNKN